MAKSKPNKFWKTIKKKSKTPKTVKSDTLTVADLFEHFKSIYGTDQFHKSI